VNVTVANHAQNRNDGVAVVPLNGSTPVLGAPAFAGADSGTAAASGVAYFHFDASRQGKYAIASTAPSRVASGEWLYFEVAASDTPPLLAVGKARYALTPAGGHA
jgi:hypothetical protein